MQKVKSNKVTKPLGLKLGLLFLLVALMFSCMLGGNPSVNAKASGKSLDVSTGDTITNYYMNIQLTSLTLGLGSKNFMKATWGEFKAWQRQNKVATLIFRFEDITYADKNTNQEMSVIATTTCDVNFPGSEGLDKDIRFNQNVTINIRETYYNYFKQAKYEGKYKRVRISLFWDGTATGLHDKTKYFVCDCKNCVYDLNITLTTKDKPPTSNDPNDPDFELGDNGGVTTIHKVASWFEKFFEWFLSIWGSSDPLDVIAQIAFVIAGIVIIVLIVKFVRWIFK